MVGVAGCGDDAPAGRGEPWPEADALFHQGPRFGGADGAYTIDLGGDRILWLFGDTSVLRTLGQTSDGFFLRNSVAIQTGLDPATAYMEHYWRWDGDEARSFFPEPDPTHWLWPGSGIRLGDTLLIFLGTLRQEGTPGPWSFEDDRAVARVVRNPDDDPMDWRLDDSPLPGVGTVALGESVLVVGNWLYVFGRTGDRHDAVLVRYALTEARDGVLIHPERYCQVGWRRTTTDDGDEAHACDYARLFRAAPEYSVHWDDAQRRYVYVGGAGFGASSIVWRTAPRPEGPWDEPTDVYRPEESFFEGAFVYAAKAHPEIPAPRGGLTVTYVPSTFDETPPELEDRYYFPRFVRVYRR